MNAIFSNGKYLSIKETSWAPIPTIRWIWIWNMFSWPVPSLLNIKLLLPYIGIMSGTFCTAKSLSFDSISSSSFPWDNQYWRDLYHCQELVSYIFYLFNFSLIYIPLFKMETRSLLPLRLLHFIFWLLSSKQVLSLLEPFKLTLFYSNPYIFEIYAVSG